jgi:ribosomal protein L11 methyltransferase
MAWQEIIFELDREAVEAWSDQLLALGALSVNAEDADADSLDEQPIYGEPGMHIPAGWQRTVLTVLAEETANPDVLLRACANALAQTDGQAHGVPAYRTLGVQEQDWVRITQAQFEPFAVGEHLWIRPSWSAQAVPTSNRTRYELVVDPGLAFGTGSHPTTKLCLRWLEAHLLANPQQAFSVIDYGCGTGILAIAAAKLGAQNVLGIDIDSQAVQATIYNAQINQVQVSAQDTKAPLPPAADIVVANILSNPLKLLAPLLCGLVKPGGYLVLSGVLARQAEEVAAVYAPRLQLRMVASDDGWACLVGQSPSRPH